MMFPGRKAMNMERVYKTMRNTGAGCIALGVIIAVTGLTVGIISILVSGADNDKKYNKASKAGLGIIHTVSLLSGVFHVFFRILRAHRH